MPFTPSPGFTDGRLPTSAFPLAHPVILSNREAFLLPGTPRLRKGGTNEQSSLPCPSIRCQLPVRPGFPSVLLVCMWGAVSRCPVFFKFKGIMAFSVKQKDISQGSQAALELSQFHRTFYLHPPEAADTVEVSIAASAAQGGILIADAAPGELFFLGVGPGSQGLNLQGLERNGGSKVLDGVWAAGCYRSSSRASREGGCGVTPGGLRQAFLTSGSALQHWAWG